MSEAKKSKEKKTKPAKAAPAVQKMTDEDGLDEDAKQRLQLAQEAIVLARIKETINVLTNLLSDEGEYGLDRQEMIQRIQKAQRKLADAMEMI